MNLWSKGLFWQFPKIQGLNLTNLDFQGLNCNFSNIFGFSTKGINMTIYDFKKTFGDFSLEILAQGLFLTIFETWGTKTANFANLIRFSSDFDIFAFKTHKTLICDILIILMCFWVFSDDFAVYFVQKWWVFTHSSCYLIVLLSLSKHNCQT